MIPAWNETFAVGFDMGGNFRTKLPRTTWYLKLTPPPPARPPASYAVRQRDIANRVPIKKYSIYVVSAADIALPFETVEILI